MAAKKSSQKYFRNNRAPRVQIEYETNIGGADVKVDLPFVMGVLSDLSGKLTEEDKANRKPVAQRDALEFDVDNFEERMRAMRPRAAFQADNALGEGKMAVDLRFESMDDFSPDAVAKRVPALKKLLEARQQLASLEAYMDGKDGAEALLARVLQDESLMKSLAAANDPESGGGGGNSGDGDSA